MSSVCAKFSWIGIFLLIFILLLSACSSGSSGDDKKNDIQDETPTLDIASANTTEGDSGAKQLQFSVTLDRLVDKNVTVDFTTSDDTAQSGSDYIASSGTLTIATGSLSGIISVDINGDVDTESDETFKINLSNANGAEIGVAAATGTIENDDQTSPNIPEPQPAPAINIADASTTEGNSGTKTLEFTVTLSQTVDHDVTVDYATGDESALAGSDYIESTGTLTISSGTNSAIISITINGDTDLEPDEIFTITLSNPTGAFLANNDAIGTIVNDESSLVPTISISDAIVAEGDSGTKNLLFTVTLDTDTVNMVTVDYTTSDTGSAVGNTDYVTSSGTLEIPAGSTTGTITILVVGDTEIEGDESFKITLSNAVAGTLGNTEATGTILNDDIASVAATISISGGSVLEGNSGQTSITFTVTLTESVAADVTVDYSTSGITATSSYDLDFGGYDFNNTTGTLTIPAQSTFASISVPVNSDTDIEGDETFALNLSNPVGAILGTASAIGTIISDELPTLRFTGLSSVTEGDSGTREYSFSVSTDQGISTNISVDFATSDGSATAGEDYVAKSGTITIPSGSTSVSESFVIAGDLDIEGNEYFTVTLSNPVSAEIGTLSKSFTIVDDDPKIAVSDASVVEGNSGTQVDMVFTISLDQPSNAPVTGNYLTSTSYTVDDATADADFVSTSGSFTINAGETSFQVNVPVIGDNEVEIDEHFALVVNTVSGATLKDYYGVGTIINDDLPTVSVNSASVAEGDSGTQQLLFIVTLDSPVSQVVTVDYATSDDIATLGDQDYAAKSGTLQIPIAANAGKISVDVTGDIDVEDNETMLLTISNPQGALLGADVATGTIENDDPGVYIDDVTVDEGDAGTTNMNFTVSLTSPLNDDVTVDFTTVDGTTTAGSDYVESSGTVIITGGTDTTTITVPVNGDTDWEIDDVFYVNLSNVSPNAFLHDTSARGIIHNDDLGGLNDTGITLCGNADGIISGNNNLICPQDSTPGQDGDYGYDVIHNDDSDGHAGFNFTKLDNNGNPLPDQSVDYATTPWACVRDNVTGLVWEVKTDDGGIHDKDTTRSWNNLPAFISDVNASMLCGFNDWRAPTMPEFRSILDFSGTFSLPVEMNFFPNWPSNITSYGFVTSTESEIYSDSLWGVEFNRFLFDQRYSKNTSQYFILVRGAQ
jgi:hypothetical protein